VPNSLDAICADVQGNFNATLGLEAGVQDQTNAALDIMREVAADLPNMDSIAVIPVGSRVKGYATLQSDIDIVVVYYSEDSHPFEARKAMGRVINERLGIYACQPCFEDEADGALTVSMIDYGHAACFNAEDIPFVLVPAVFEGSRVAELNHSILIKKRWERARYFERAESSFNRKLILPKQHAEVPQRYMDLCGASGSVLPAPEDVEQSITAAYDQRRITFGGNIAEKILEQLTLHG
jgi:predicted nucleotidyltransferase